MLAPSAVALCALAVLLSGCGPGETDPSGATLGAGSNPDVDPSEFLVSLAPAALRLRGLLLLVAPAD